MQTGYSANSNSGLVWSRDIRILKSFLKLVLYIIFNSKAVCQYVHLGLHLTCGLFFVLEITAVIF